MPKAYLTKSSLAAELEIGESTVDEYVRRRILPPPVKLSSGCARWRWASVDLALASMGGASDDNEQDVEAGVQRALREATKGSRDRRSPEGGASR